MTIGIQLYASCHLANSHKTSHRAERSPLVNAIVPQRPLTRPSALLLLFLLLLISTKVSDNTNVRFMYIISLG